MQKCSKCWKPVKYIYPFDNSAKGNGAESAKRAGYAAKTAYITAAQLQKNAIIMVEIKKFRANVSEKLVKTNVFNQIADFVSSIEKRSKYRVIDYYDVETAVSNEGYEYTKATPKPFDKLTDEQKDLLEGVEYNQRGIPNYKLPNRHECLNDLLKIYKDIYSDDKDKDNDGLSVSTVYDLIKGKIETKVEEIRQRLEEDNSYFCYTPPEAATNLIEAIINYGCYGRIAELKDWKTKAIFTLIKAQIDRDRGVNR